MLPSISICKAKVDRVLMRMDDGEETVEIMRRCR